MARDWRFFEIRDKLLSSHRTQQDLAAALGIAPSGVSRLLAGRRALKASELPKIDRFFETHETELLPNQTRRYEDGSWRPLQQAISHRLQIAIAIGGVEMPELAQENGLSLDRLEAILQGRGAFPDISVWSFLAQNVGVDRDWLMFGGQGSVRPTKLNSLKENKEIDADAPNETGRLSIDAQHPEQSLPVYSHYASSSTPAKKCAWRLAQFVSPPQQLMGVNEAFGVYVGDNFLLPRLFRGDLIYIHPWRLPRPYGLAAGMLGDGSGILIGIVADITDTEIVLEGMDWWLRRDRVQHKYELSTLKWVGTVIATEPA